MRRIFGDIAPRLRTIPGIGSMIPIAAGGLTICLATMSKPGLVGPGADLDDRRLALRDEPRSILRDLDLVEQAAVDQFINHADEPPLRDETGRARS